MSNVFFILIDLDSIIFFFLALGRDCEPLVSEATAALPIEPQPIEQLHLLQFYCLWAISQIMNFNHLQDSVIWLAFVELFSSLSNQPNDHRAKTYPAPNAIRSFKNYGKMFYSLDWNIFSFFVSSKIWEK